jgi:glycosyltransferase involved in cell wall biosynthesis
MTLRVLILTQWFDPEPTFKGLAFARELVRQGFDVSVVTGFPNYPNGRLYPGYRLRPLLRQRADGVRIYRVPLFPSHDRSMVRRALNYASFAASALIAGLFVAPRVDVIYIYHPPLSVGVTGALLALVTRRPFIYDVQDIWPDTLRATGLISNERLLALIAAMCRWVYRKAALIAVLSPGFKRLLVARGVPEAKIEVVLNWADESSLDSATAALPNSFPSSNQFRILFAGNMGAAQALDTVLEAGRVLQERGSRVAFIMLGSGVDLDRLRSRAEALALRNVTFLPPVPMRDVGAYLAAADALLVHLRDDPLFEITIPSKIQAYMAAGRPLLLAVRGDAAALVEESGGGITVAPEDPQALAAAADSLAALPKERLAQMGQRARAFYEANLSIERGVARFSRMFQRVVAQ